MEEGYTQLGTVLIDQRPADGEEDGVIVVGRFKGDRLMAALVRIVASHPVAAFMVIGLAGFLTAAIRPIAKAEVLPYGLPLHGFLGGLFGVGLSALLVTGALAGRDGVVDLARRSLR
jgi:hypothetical protein